MYADEQTNTESDSILLPILNLKKLLRLVSAYFCSFRLRSVGIESSSVVLSSPDLSKSADVSVGLAL